MAWLSIFLVSSIFNQWREHWPKWQWILEYEARPVALTRCECWFRTHHYRVTIWVIPLLGQQIVFWIKTDSATHQKQRRVSGCVQRERVASIKILAHKLNATLGKKEKKMFFTLQQMEYFFWSRWEDEPLRNLCCCKRLGFLKIIRDSCFRKTGAQFCDSHLMRIPEIHKSGFLWTAASSSCTTLSSV